MIYSETIKMDESGRLTECPRCENEEFSANAKFCRICGLPLFNCCSDEMCGTMNPVNARFCEICGAPTVFNTIGVLKPYDGRTVKTETLPADSLGDELPY